MRRPRIPASTHIRCFRTHQGFNVGTYEHTTFAGHVSGARPVTDSCLSSPQRRATRQRKPSPRSVLHNAIPGPRQLSMAVSPSSGPSSRGNSLTGNFFWKRGQTRAETQAGPLRRLHQPIPGFVRTSVPPPPGRQRYHAKHAPASYRSLRDSLVQSTPSADEAFPKNAPAVPTSQAEAGATQTGGKNRRSKTILDQDVRVNPVGRPRTVKRSGDDAIRTLLRRLGRADISEAKFNDANKLSGDAVVIFLRRTGPDDSHGSDIFKRASEVFGQEQLVHATIPWGLTGAPPWAPPELDKIRLEGEEDAAVPVFDSCDEVRAKIAAYLGQPDGPSQWQLCKAIHGNRKARNPTKVHPAKLKRFMAMQGPSAGNFNVIYYAAYVFFEKLRIAEGRPKSSHRLEMEKLFPRGLESNRS